MLEKVFCIRREKNHTIYKFLGLSLKISCCVNIKQVLNFYNNIVDDKTILIIEPNDCHYETMLGYYKYLYELGYNVEILTRGNCYKLFSDKDLVAKVWECNKKTFDFIFKYCNFSKYYCLFFNSKRVYWKNNNKNNDGSDIYKCYKKIPKGRFENIYVQHHLDYWNEYKREQQIALANPTKNPELENCVVNPHYFGNVKITPKNENITKFITVGGLNIARRNSDLLIDAVKELHSNGITNFEIIVISSDKLEAIPEEIRKYFRILGKVDFPELFRAMEDADYFLPLLDPEVEKHQRYMKHGTSGSFQLIYGFLKPCIIHRTFADIYGFSNEDSLVYEKNIELYESMHFAMSVSKDEYEKMLCNLNKNVKNIENKSFECLRKIVVR